MRLLLIFPSLLRGGAEEYALVIARAAVAKGFEVHVSFPDLPGTFSLKQDFLCSGVIFHPLLNAYEPLLSFDLIAKGPSYIFRVLLLCRKISPDVVQIVLPSPERCFAPILAAAMLKIPAAIVFQLVPPDLPKINSFRKRVYHWARARMQKWISISDNNRALLAQLFDVSADTISLVYNGSTACLQGEAGDVQEVRRDIRQALGLPESASILLTVGRYDSQKGYDLLIKLAPKILQLFPNVFFVWVGDGELRDFLQNEIKRLGLDGRVIMTGYRPDISRFMLSADLFVFPTRYEGGQSFVITEAMSCGLPIVSTSASGIPEVIRNRKDGLLSDVEDVEMLSDNIICALQNPKMMRLMSQNARERVNDFSEEKMITQTIELLEMLGGEK